ncbi:MAG: malto-oligosyltrehalose trehalohydrolase, partial [Vicinamibacterales bacterium]
TRTTSSQPATRRLSGGVELRGPADAHARVWAPRAATVDLVLDADRDHPIALARHDDGIFEGTIARIAAGDRYWFRIDGDRLRPDPVSRWQPDGPHGPSAVVDPAAFPWTDDHWPGVGRAGQVIYELHIGTFTPEGTWAAAAEQLRALKALGVTIVEMMPIADFPGRFGWGYDGVNLYAPTRLYGTPEDLRRFIDRAHGAGLAVILDVVYNHLGPDGNYLNEFSVDYFTDKYTNDWGRAINFEGPAAARALFVENAGYWIEEFHFDGLRFDATQDIKDASPEHVLASLARRAREAAGRRSIFMVAENEPQHTVIVRPPSSGGYGLDALWNDDYHHTALVALTARREAYYTDYTGSAQEFVSSAKYGYLYQGQRYSWQEQSRGTPALDLPGAAFVNFLENHDQVANSAFGKRLHQLTSPGKLRALTALTLLGSATPMLFQGQEFAASTPFLFFADHGPELGTLVAAGRRTFLEQFPSLTDRTVQERLAPPSDARTFERCKLDLSERERHPDSYALHRDLLALRRDDAVIRAAATARVDGAVLTSSIFVLRYAPGAADDRLLIINLGIETTVALVPEPLLAPPFDCEWQVAWHSESVAYGGSGRAPLAPAEEWRVPGEAAVLLTARRRDPATPATTKARATGTTRTGEGPKA